MSMNNINPNFALLPLDHAPAAGAPAQRPTLEAVTQLAHQLRAQSAGFLPMIHVYPFGAAFAAPASAVAREAMSNLRQVFLDPDENMDQFSTKLRTCSAPVRQQAKQVVELALSLDNSLFDAYHAASELLEDESSRLTVMTPQGNFGVTRPYAHRVMLYQVTGDPYLRRLPYPTNAGPIPAVAPSVQLPANQGGPANS
jgi:hypothetical protein